MYNNVCNKETDTYDTKKKETTAYNSISSDNCGCRSDYRRGVLYPQ